MEYVRYKSDLIIPIYKEDKLNNSQFDYKLEIIYEELNLEVTTINISVGGNAVQSLGGWIFVNRLGFVNLIESGP